MSVFSEPFNTGEYIRSQQYREDQFNTIYPSQWQGRAMTVGKAEDRREEIGALVPATKKPRQH